LLTIQLRGGTTGRISPGNFFLNTFFLYSLLLIPEVQ
jgi:hypothetical protein